jgi:replicative DNA helicase
MGAAQRNQSRSFGEASPETPTPAQLRTDDRFETEASLLGALLHYGDHISYRLAAAIVAPKHFNDVFNARLFSIIGKGFDAQLKAFPLVHFVITELRDDPTLEELNTSASAIVTEYITRCAPQIGIEGCARQVRHDYLNDKLKAAVEEGESAQTEHLAVEMRQLKNAHLFKDEGSQAISKSVPAILDRIAELHQNGVMPNTDAYPGSHQLQQLFGGWRRGKFFVLGGRPGMGKSTAALSWLLKTAERGHGVMLFSLEMTLPELTEIALCDLAWSHNRRIEYRDIASTSARAEGLDWKYEVLRTASERFTAMPFTIVDKSSLTLADIRAQAAPADETPGNRDACGRPLG